MTHYYCTLTLDGTVTSPFSTDADVPAGATVISQDQYNTTLAVLQAGGTCAMVAGVLIPRAAILVPTPPSLEQLKAAATQQIDTTAEATRGLFLTAGAGQAMEYEATMLDAAKAKNVLAADPTAVLLAADYPWLASEQNALASINVSKSIAEVADLVAQEEAGWTLKGSEIKQTRRGGKLRVEVAQSADEVASVLASLVWPTA